MIRTIAIICTLVLVVSAAFAAGHLSLGGVSHVAVDMSGHTVLLKTTDGTPAGSKLSIGRTYSLISSYTGKPSVIGRVVITKASGIYAKGRETVTSR